RRDVRPARCLAELAVEAAGEAYPGTAHTFSALDLRQLDQVTRLFDTFILALLQSLGDEVVWDARERIFGRIREAHDDVVAYDLREMLELCQEKLTEAARQAVTKWFAKQGERHRQRRAKMPRRLHERGTKAPRGAALEQALREALPELPRPM